MAEKNDSGASTVESHGKRACSATTGAGKGDRVRHEQVGAGDRVAQLLVRRPHLRHQQLADDDLAALHGIHDALE